MELEYAPQTAHCHKTIALYELEGVGNTQVGVTEYIINNNLCGLTL